MSLSIWAKEVCLSRVQLTYILVSMKALLYIFLLREADLVMSVHLTCDDMAPGKNGEIPLKMALNVFTK